MKNTCGFSFISRGLLVCIFGLSVLAACKPTPPSSAPTAEAQQGGPLLAGRWRALINLDDAELPFNFDLVLENTTDKYSMYILNGEERLPIRDINIEGDSVFIQFPVYESEIRGKFNERRIIGSWVNHAKGEETPFYAAYGDSTRFISNVVDKPLQVAGRYDVMFIGLDKKSKTDAIAEFSQNGTRVTGTFLTTTGDMRYLEGVATEQELFLSAFDGAHAYVLKATQDNIGDLDGYFWSDNNKPQKWITMRNDTATLPSPYTLTTLKKGQDKIALNLTAADGKTLSLSDPAYQNKVVLIQLMGSWCPNCKDQTAWLNELYRSYRADGLEVIGLAFENKPDAATAEPLLQRYRQHFNLSYPIVYAGKADKTAAGKLFPNLSEIKAFPTLIMLDRQGKVKHIFTGFNGPATQEYKKDIQQLEQNVQMLLQENA